MKCRIEGCFREDNNDSKFIKKHELCGKHYQSEGRKGNIAKRYMRPYGFSLNEVIDWEINRAVRNRETDCLEYKFGTFSKGYPQFLLKGKWYKLSRVILSRRLKECRGYGLSDSDELVRHKCDNPLCIEVNHLEVGSAQDNSQDSVDRGRTLKGLKNNSVKVNAFMIRQCLQMYKNGRTLKNISILTGVPKSTIYQWKVETSRMYWRNELEAEEWKSVYGNYV